MPRKKAQVVEASTGSQENVVELSLDKPTPPKKRGRPPRVTPTPAHSPVSKPKEVKIVEAENKELTYVPNSIDYKINPNEFGGKRMFTLIYSSINPPIPEDKMRSAFKTGGKYYGSNPNQAASKAFTQIARQLYNGDECNCTFAIQENTGSPPVVFSAERVRLKNPVSVEKDGVTFKIYFKNNVKPVKTTTLIEK